MDRKKTGPFATLRILEKYTDEEHLLTLEQVVDHMESEYGITADRRTIYDNFTILESFGYNIDRFRAGHRGYSLIKRSYTVDQVVEIINTLRAAGTFKEKELKKIEDGMTKDFSTYQKKALKEAKKK